MFSSSLSAAPRAALRQKSERCVRARDPLRSRRCHASPADPYLYGASSPCQRTPCAPRSRSSSLIQSATSSRPKVRGAGSGRPSSRRLAASDRIRRRRSSALSRLAADSISRKLPIACSDFTLIAQWLGQPSMASLIAGHQRPHQRRPGLAEWRRGVPRHRSLEPAILGIALEGLIEPG